jgi:hypothetical protein
MECLTIQRRRHGGAPHSAAAGMLHAVRRNQLVSARKCLRQKGGNGSGHARRLGRLRLLWPYDRLDGERTGDFSGCVAAHAIGDDPEFPIV